MRVLFNSPSLEQAVLPSEALTTPKVTKENSHVLNYALQENTHSADSKKSSITGIAALRAPDDAAM